MTIFSHFYTWLSCIKIIGAPPPPPPQKILHIIFFYLLIYRACVNTLRPKKSCLCILKIGFKICLFDCFYTFVNGFSFLPPSLAKWWPFFSPFLLVSFCFRRKMRIFYFIFFVLGGGGGMSAQNLSGPLRNPKAPPPPCPLLKISWLRHWCRKGVAIDVTRWAYW